MKETIPNDVSRRKVIRSIAAFGTAAVAGCAQSTPDSQQGSPNNNQNTEQAASSSGLIRGWEVDGVDLVVELENPEQVANLKLRGPDGEYKYFAGGGLANPNDQSDMSRFGKLRSVSGERTHLPLHQTASGDSFYDYEKTTYVPGPQTIVAVDSSGTTLDEMTTDPISPNIQIKDIGFTDDASNSDIDRPDNKAPYVEISNTGTGPTYIRALFQHMQQSGASGSIISRWRKTPLPPNDTTIEYVNMVGTICNSEGTRTVPVGAITLHGTYAVEVEKSFKVMEVESGTWETDQCVVQRTEITNETHRYQGKAPLPNEI
jgi:hypothetical protein